MTDLKDINDIKRKLVIVNQDKNRIEVPDRETLKQLIFTLENSNRKYFVVEI